MTPVQPTSIGIMLVSHFRQPWAARARSAVPRVILGSCGAQAQSAGPGAENPIIAPPTTIRLVSGSLGHQGRRTRDHKQKKRPLRSLQPLECCWAAYQEWLPKMTSMVVGCAGSHFLLLALRPALLAARHDTLTRSTPSSPRMPSPFLPPTSPPLGHLAVDLAPVAT